MSVLPIEQAREALTAVGFPILKADEITDSGVCVRPGGGREAYLPGDLFEPTPYQLREPDLEDIDDKSTNRARRQVVDAWAGPTHVEAILNSFHDGYGSRVGLYILGRVLRKQACGITPEQLLLQRE